MLIRLICLAIDESLIARPVNVSKDAKRAVVTIVPIQPLLNLHTYLSAFLANPLECTGICITPFK